MKKIDFHIHTISTQKDLPFEFDLNVLQDYVIKCNIDAIAITNHNVFDVSQFKNIENTVKVIVYPGIEIDLEACHILIITQSKDLIDFSRKCSQLNTYFIENQSCLNYEKLKIIFGDLSKYLIIPHYEKNPKILPITLKKFGSLITCGEVSNSNKFFRVKKQNLLVPVLFSDSRIDKELKTYSLKQTYIDLEEITFSHIKEVLRDKTKIYINSEKSDNLFAILEDGTLASTGLNVLCGKRSSGKSYTLDKIYKNFDNVKYIEQFSLIEKNKKTEDEKFSEMLSKKKALETQEYLNEFKQVVDKLLDIDVSDQSKKLEEYIESLKLFAGDLANHDSFSKAAIFVEQKYNITPNIGIMTLINSIGYVLDNTMYREIIGQYINLCNLKKLIIKLIETYREELIKIKLYESINNTIDLAKRELEEHSSASVIGEFNLSDYIKDSLMISKFNELVEVIKKEKNILNEPIMDFKIVAEKAMINSSSELQNIIKKKGEYKTAFDLYDKPYDYLMKLKDLNHIPKDQIYKCFCSINYFVQNKFGFCVSGGERSEFYLEEQLYNARDFDMLLIDEPESSFDNIFLKDKINDQIKNISKKMPVIVSTHNNTIGASIMSDYILFAERTINSTNQTIDFSVYGGPTIGKQLKNIKGNVIPNFTVFMDCFEAGEDTYKGRSETYENIKN